VSPDIDPAGFRQLLGRFATGVVVLTTVDAAGRPVGMTANSLSSVSLTPPLVAVNVELRAEAHAALTGAARFVVNILAATQETVSRRFAQTGGDHFAGIGYRLTPGGEAILDGVLAHIECERFATYPGGDHTILVGRVTGGAPHEGAPLLYYRGGYAGLCPG
jgi:flavin reductase (DIM6/NTAB) family NADH-FMN oxidoreductase RutF